jgi:hypothetical protein
LLGTLQVSLKMKSVSLTLAALAMLSSAEAACVYMDDGSYFTGCGVHVTEATCIGPTESPGACGWQHAAIANCATQVTDQCSACDPGFSLASNACADINECATNPCGANGACSTPVINAYSCACTTGYSGTNCDVDIDDCASGPCDNGGTCTDKVNAYECACADGYSGATCAINIDECAGVDCGGASTCSDGVFEYNCACAAGWEGGGKDKVRDTPSLQTHISPRGHTRERKVRYTRFPTQTNPRAHARPQGLHRRRGV